MITQCSLKDRNIPRILEPSTIFATVILHSYYRKYPESIIFMERTIDSTTQQEHMGHAFVGLGMMCLSTSLLQAYLGSAYWKFDKARTERQLEAFTFVTIFLFMGLAAIWLIGLNFWIREYGYISIIQRNKSLICGLGAANIGLIWVFLRVSWATVQTYAIYFLWPTYLGLVAGTLL